jgi:hypothetical protein
MIPASLLVPPVVVAVVSAPAVVVPSVALSVVVVVSVVIVSVSPVVSGISNSSCAKAKEGRYCCPSMALDAKSPVAAIENTAAARSYPFVKICCVGKDFINQGRSN